jgi:hypothetical protein
MKKSQTLKAMFEIETVFKFQSDSRALHLTLPQTETTTTSSTSLVTSFQTIGFNKLSNDLRM